MDKIEEELVCHFQEANEGSMETVEDIPVITELEKVTLEENVDKYDVKLTDEATSEEDGSSEFQKQGIVEERVAATVLDKLSEVPLEPLAEESDCKNDSKEDTLVAPNMSLPKMPSESDISEKEKPNPGKMEEYYLQVLGQYLANVQKKDTHSKFLQDAVVGPFLSLCLASNSDKVLISALKVINVLVKNRANLPRLRELLHFMDALQAASRNENIHAVIRNKAATFHDHIQNPKRPLGNSGQDNTMEKSGSSEGYKSSTSVRKTQLHINHELHKERRHIITRKLVKIEGVISIAFNPEHRLCIIRSRRVPPETLGIAVANLGFECSLLSKNENHETVRIPMVAEFKQKNEEAPFYFPEDDEEEPVGENAVALQGFTGNENDAGWWSSAKQMVRKSLFW